MKKFLLATLVVVSTMLVGNAYADCTFGNYSSGGRKLTSFGLTDGVTTQSVSVNQTTSGSIYYNGTIDEKGRLTGLPNKFTSGYSYNGYMELQQGCVREDGSIEWPCPGE